MSCLVVIGIVGIFHLDIGLSWRMLRVRESPPGGEEEVTIRTPAVLGWAQLEILSGIPREQKTDLQRKLEFKLQLKMK